MPSLFDPIKLGAVAARNRILMAPLTRGRATMDHVPTPMMIDYYRQRAGAGLIISEATGISAQGLGWPYAPGIWNPDQIEVWRMITAAVHESGGLMFSQLWHMGRLVHPSLPGRGQPVSSSATTMPGLARTYEGKHAHVQAKAMTREDIRNVIADYRKAATNAMNAGFDGVEIHAANFISSINFCATMPISGATNTAARSKIGSGFSLRSRRLLSTPSELIEPQCDPRPMKSATA